MSLSFSSLVVDLELKSTLQGGFAFVMI